MTRLEVVQRRHPQKYDDSLLRTLQRRVHTGNARCGKAHGVLFSPEHPPGNQGFSDFTNAAVLRLMISGDVQLHLLHQFALAYSGWRHVEVVLGGGSFIALSSGLQNAI